MTRAAPSLSFGTRRSRQSATGSGVNAYNSSRYSSGKKHALNEPERAGGNDDERAGEHQTPSGGLVTGAERRKGGGDRDDGQQLSDFDADVECEQRPSERAARQVHRFEHVREPESMNEPERERNPCSNVSSPPHHEIVGADVDDAERNRGLDDASRRAHDVQRGERERHAVRQR